MWQLFFQKGFKHYHKMLGEGGGGGGASNCKFQLLKLLKQTVDDYARDGRPGEV